MANIRIHYKYTLLDWNSPVCIGWWKSVRLRCWLRIVPAAKVAEVLEKANSWWPDVVRFTAKRHLLGNDLINVRKNALKNLFLLLIMENFALNAASIVGHQQAQGMECIRIVRQWQLSHVINQSVDWQQVCTEHFTYKPETYLVLFCLSNTHSTRANDSNSVRMIPWTKPYISCCSSLCSNTLNSHCLYSHFSRHVSHKRT